MNRWVLAVGLLAGAAAVFVAGRCSAPAPAGPGGPPAAPLGDVVEWYCPMHPEVRRPGPGSCPKCGMDLVPLQEGSDPGPRRLALAPEAVALAGIRTAPVERRFLSLPVRLVGKVEFDETQVRTIAARVPGRLDRLFVDFTGIPVREGDHLVLLYSPQLLQAQQELIEARRRLEATAGEASEFLAASNRRGYEAAREKLRLWGLTVAQVDAVEERGTAEDHMLIRSPTEGVVIHKARNEGDYVEMGTAIYRIADLGQLWIVLDAYEQDLPWIRYGQPVTVTTEALPGMEFAGRVTFVAPTVDERTRTVRVRVNVRNEQRRLKPGMFVRAVVRARIGAGGALLEPTLAGQWICPMHPEVVAPGPGQCTVCGMDLETAASLGLVREDPPEQPLVVPASAVLLTGTRAVAYVEVPGAERPLFEGREVVLGPRAGEHYVVRAGLREHERVVVHGAFRIDSAMQIRAKPSMMSLRGDAFPGPEAAGLRAALAPVYGAYAELRDALAADDDAAARAAAVRLHEVAGRAEGGELPREAEVRWEEQRELLVRAAGAAAEASSLASLRRHFEDASRAMLALERTFGHAGSGPRYEVFCPMAFDNRGAAWLQDRPEVQNPYFGASMLACGEIRTELPGAGPPAAPDAALDASGLAAVYDGYLSLQTALAGDDADGAAAAWERLARAVAAAPAPAAGGAAFARLREALAGEPPRDVAALRAAFRAVSDALLALHEAAGHPGDETLYRVHCPMAFDNEGADWLQRGRTVDNPYFGARMLRCGTITAELPPRGDGR